METKAPARAFCKGCYYPLQGLSETRCPECGQAFDLSDASTYSIQAHPPRIQRRLGTALVLLGAPVSALLVLISGESLLLWYFGRATDTMVGWGGRFWIATAETQFSLGTLSMLAMFAGLVMARGCPHHLPLRCLSWAAGIWWLGWLLSFQFGWIVYHL